MVELKGALPGGGRPCGRSVGDRLYLDEDCRAVRDLEGGHGRTECREVSWEATWRVRSGCAR